MKKNFKTYVQKMHQDVVQKLLDMVSQDPMESRKLAVNFLETNRPVPEQLLKSVGSLPNQSIRLADAYAQKKIQPPRNLLWGISDDPEYSFMLSSSLLANKMQIPDMIMNGVLQNIKSTIRFATAWHTYHKDNVPEPVLKKIASNSYYAQQYKNFLEVSDLPVPSLIEKNAKKDATEESDENDGSVAKYKDQLLQVVGNDPNESINLIQKLAEKGVVAPLVLFASVINHHKETFNSDFGNFLVKLTNTFYEKDMQLPEIFYQYTLETFPTVIIKNHMNKNLPVPKKALQKVLKNSFQTASIVSFLLTRKKEISPEMIDVLTKDPKVINYLMGDIIRFIENNFTLKDASFYNFMTTQFPKKLLQIIKQNPSVREDIVKILKNSVSEKIIKKLF